MSSHTQPCPQILNEDNLVNLGLTVRIWDGGCVPVIKNKIIKFGSVERAAELEGICRPMGEGQQQHRKRGLIVATFSRDS
jgi:hypothetical protein